MTGALKPRMGTRKIEFTPTRKTVFTGLALTLGCGFIFAFNVGNGPASVSPAVEPSPSQTVTRVEQVPVPGPTVTIQAPAPKPVTTCAEYVALADDMRAAVLDYEKYLGKMSGAYSEGTRALADKDWDRVNKALTRLNDLDAKTSGPALKIAELDDDMQAARQRCDAAR